MFGHLKQLEVVDRTARFTLHAIKLLSEDAPAPVLIVRPASEANKGYFNALLKHSRTYAAQVQAGAVTESAIAENRKQDVALYAAHVVIGWENVVGADGSPVSFSKEACADLLGALPNWLFDDLRMFCGRPVNFLPESMNVEEKAKN